MRSLASSITTLFPLITTIPILFCVFWGEIFRSRSLDAFNINTQKWMLLENVRHTCLVNSMESSSTRFMKGSKPQRVPSTWKIFQHQTLLWNYSITHPPQPIIWHHHHTHALLQNYSIPSPHGHRWSWGEPSCPWTSSTPEGGPSTSFLDWEGNLKE